VITWKHLGGHLYEVHYSTHQIYYPWTSYVYSGVGGGWVYSTMASDGLGRLKLGIHILDWSTRWKDISGIRDTVESDILNRCKALNWLKGEECMRKNQHWVWVISNQRTVAIPLLFPLFYIRVACGMTSYSLVSCQQLFRGTCCMNPLFLHWRWRQQILRNPENNIREYTVSNSKDQNLNFRGNLKFRKSLHLTRIVKLNSQLRLLRRSGMMELYLRPHKSSWRGA
jgi:hypothetical protein